MRALAGLAAALLLAVAPADARAAFPGRNGPIAYTVAHPDSADPECPSPFLIRAVHADNGAQRDLFRRWLVPRGLGVDADPSWQPLR